jgi:nucleoside-diphosphate-sugar epimerase
MPTERSEVRILVTGGCGYVGSKLTEALLARDGYRVTVLDAMWFGNFLPAHPRLTLLEQDMRKIDAVDLSSFDTIFHLANIANDPAVELNPYASWDVNVLATMRLAERAVRQGVKQIVFASSGSVYGVTPEPRVTEETDLNPLSEYNKTKMVAERVILSYRDSLVTTVIRPATVCGPSPRMRLDLTVNLLTMQALSHGAMTVLGGSQVRPNIHIDDLVDVYLFALDRRLAGVYNAGFENLSILDIAERIASHVPAAVRILPSNDPRSYRQCSDRLVAAGFVPARNVSTAVQQLAVLYAAGRLRDHPAWHNVSWMKQHNLS